MDANDLRNIQRERHAARSRQHQLQEQQDRLRREQEQSTITQLTQLNGRLAYINATAEQSDTIDEILPSLDEAVQLSIASSDQPFAQELMAEIQQQVSELVNTLSSGRLRVIYGSREHSHLNELMQLLGDRTGVEFEIQAPQMDVSADEEFARTVAQQLQLEEQATRISDEEFARQLAAGADQHYYPPGMEPPAPRTVAPARPPDEFDLVLEEFKSIHMQLRSLHPRYTRETQIIAVLRRMERPAEQLEQLLQKAVPDHKLQEVLKLLEQIKVLIGKHSRYDLNDWLERVNDLSDLIA